VFGNFVVKVGYPVCDQRLYHKHLITYLAVAKKKVTVCDSAEEKSGIAVCV
jgi:hypothetical protein